ncbi:MAG: hypothetical protein KH543_00005, partial [Clostridiaceae bacterium]|nr:hypothetical protein [Clostridiaceae bacterium]
LRVSRLFLSGADALPRSSSSPPDSLLKELRVSFFFALFNFQGPCFLKKPCHLPFYSALITGKCAFNLLKRAIIIISCSPGNVKYFFHSFSSFFEKRKLEA